MNLNHGINLGGFLSQCEHNEHHYENFIGQQDIKKIADCGFDHVRLPIDYEVLEDEKGNMKESGYKIINRIISWCEAYGLNIILDLHKAYGYDFNDAGNAERNNLFTNEALQDRFINLWINIAGHFAHNNNVAFELLNEVVEKENAALWNKLIARSVKAIRNVAKDIPIIYGGIQWNSANTLKLLDIPTDKNIIFTFHFYEPLLFTHQKAYWVEAMDKNETINYPETIEYYRTKSISLGYQGEAVIKAHSKTMGEEFIEEMVQEAVLAAKNAGVQLYCGEFGVIDKAPIFDTFEWFKDVDRVFRKHKIGWALWNYKEKDFGLTGKHYEKIWDSLLSLWMRDCK